MARPVFNAYVVNEREGAKSQWREVGAVWPNQNGNGYTLVVYDQISVSGRIMLIPPKDNTAAPTPEGDDDEVPY